MMRWKKWNEEVEFSCQALTILHKGDITRLKMIADQNIRKRSRVCAHNCIDDSIHEMFIIHQIGAYVRPHKHVNKIESVHIIEGRADLVLFDPAGNVEQVVKMGNYQSNLCFFFRMAEPQYHTLLVRSDILFFHETTAGPFSYSDTIFPDWAPADKDFCNIKSFMDELEAKLRSQF